MTVIMDIGTRPTYNVKYGIEQIKISLQVKLQFYLGYIFYH